MKGSLGHSVAVFGTIKKIKVTLVSYFFLIGLALELVTGALQAELHKNL